MIFRKKIHAFTQDSNSRKLLKKLLKSAISFAKEQQDYIVSLHRIIDDQKDTIKYLESEIERRIE